MCGNAVRTSMNCHERRSDGIRIHATSCTADCCLTIMLAVTVTVLSVFFYDLRFNFSVHRSHKLQVWQTVPTDQHRCFPDVGRIVDLFHQKVRYIGARDKTVPPTIRGRENPVAVGRCS